MLGRRADAAGCEVAGVHPPHRLPVHEVWGTTELAGATSANAIYGVNKPGTIGLPYPGNEFRVVDVEDASKEMPLGERGELMYRGPMQGYYDNAKATAETIRPDGWLHTGDIATMDEAGTRPSSIARRT